MLKPINYDARKLWFAEGLTPGPEAQLLRDIRHTQMTLPGTVEVRRRIGRFSLRSTGRTRRTHISHDAAQCLVLATLAVPTARPGCGAAFWKAHATPVGRGRGDCASP